MFEELDRLIVKAVSESNATPLYQADVVAEGERIAGITGQFGFRVIDGRIQALSRRGFAVVPVELPHAVLGDAAIAGVAETGDLKHVWDFLISATRAT